MILYHGSNVAVNEIDLSYCKPFKDFGKGFYLTTLPDQAESMARRTVARFGCGEPTVSVFSLADNWDTIGLSTLIFEEPSREWATFVVNNRNRDFIDDYSPFCNRNNQYDIVVDPVANDKIVASFQLYLNGFITLDDLIERLRYQKLSDQYSFHTDKAVALLENRGIL